MTTVRGRHHMEGGQKSGRKLLFLLVVPLIRGTTTYTSSVTSPVPAHRLKVDSDAQPDEISSESDDEFRYLTIIPQCEECGLERTREELVKETTTESGSSRSWLGSISKMFLHVFPFIIIADFVLRKLCSRSARSIQTLRRTQITYFVSVSERDKFLTKLLGIYAIRGIPFDMQTGRTQKFDKIRAQDSIVEDRKGQSQSKVCLDLRATIFFVVAIFQTLSSFKVEKKSKIRNKMPSKVVAGKMHIKHGARALNDIMEEKTPDAALFDVKARKICVINGIRTPDDVVEEEKFCGPILSVKKGRAQVRNGVRTQADVLEDENHHYHPAALFDVKTGRIPAKRFRIQAEEGIETQNKALFDVKTGKINANVVQTQADVEEIKHQNKAFPDVKTRKNTANEVLTQVDVKGVKKPNEAFSDVKTREITANVASEGVKTQNEAHFDVKKGVMTADVGETQVNVEGIKKPNEAHFDVKTGKITTDVVQTQVNVEGIKKQNEVLFDVKTGKNHAPNGAQTKAKEGKTNKRPNGVPKPTSSRNYVIAIIGMTLLSFGDACDVLALVNSRNKTTLCPDSICLPESLPLRIQKGYEICVVNDQAERVMLLQVTDILVRVRYELAYYTTDYTNTLKYACACCDHEGDGECRGSVPCDTRAERKFRTRHQVHDNVKIYYDCVKALEEKLYVNCNFQKTSVRKGALYGILRKSKEVGKIKFTKIVGDYLDVIELDEAEYYFSLKKSNIPSSDFISISVLNSSSRTSPNRSLLYYEDEFYYVNSAEVQRPLKGLFGDFQVGLEDLAEHYDFRTYATCEPVKNCDANCSLQYSSKISSFPSRKAKFEQPRNLLVKKTGPLVVESLEAHENSEAYILLESWSGNQELKRDKRSEVR